MALFDGLSSELVTLALRGAPPDMTEAVLSAIGARSRRCTRGTRQHVRGSGASGHVRDASAPGIE